MWTEAHRARHDVRLKEIVSLNAVAEVARWLERVDPPRSGRATPYGAVVRAIAWAPAHRRPVAGAAARRAALAHRVWLVSQVDEPGAVRPLAGGCRPPTPPGCGPQGQASPEHHRHASGQGHPGARARWVRRQQEGARAQARGLG